MIALLVIAAVASPLPDRGIYPELAAETPLVASPKATGRVWLRVDAAHRILTVYDGGQALSAYPIAIGRGASGNTTRALGIEPGDPSARSPKRPGLVLAPADARTVERLASPDNPVQWSAPSRSEDLDGDGIVDRLDILLGAKKLLRTHAQYLDRYVSLDYPGGDVPRSEGVCSDTVIRALRNAGIDLQKEVHEDILRSPGSYPMVEKIDASINHRRVRTLLPWFKRHFSSLPSGSAYLPGDVVFFDTMPDRDGPDHLGVISDQRGHTGFPLVINHWAPGTVDAEMDLLPVIPVTHHFRVRSSVHAPPIVD